MKSKADGVAGQARQIVDARPCHDRARAVGAHRHAGLGRERRDGPPVAVEQFDAQLAVRRVDVDEQMAYAESNGSRRQRPGRRRRRHAPQRRRRATLVHRREAVAPQHGEPCAADAWVVRTRPAATPAHVEVQLVSDDHTASAR